MALPMIEIDNVSKEYRLGAIGGTTLNAEIQTKLAKLRGKEDPNSKIGARQHEKNERFLALNGVSFNVQPGEAVGIIGHNGAGKSTLLKLISRVTAPSGGEIRLRGRVASMLEVGTGFHPELTGRENVYMNGAILGMTKAEIDRKFDQIVEFAEIAQFIDTPVKRYSSGMYVKLAFSVAAHLDSEIMIMDEVLAVGDAKFQNKCLGRMGDEAAGNNRTILYVSHNMSTIQRLCTRVLILDHGKLMYDGDTAGGVAQYLSVNRNSETESDLLNLERNKLCKLSAQFEYASFPDKENNLVLQDGKMPLRIKIRVHRDVSNLVLRLYFKHVSASNVGFSTVPLGDHKKGSVIDTVLELDLKGIAPGSFIIGAELHEIDASGTAVWQDGIENILQFRILTNENRAVTTPPDYSYRIPWYHTAWGSVRIPANVVER